MLEECNQCLRRGPYCSIVRCMTPYPRRAGPRHYTFFYNYTQRSFITACTGALKWTKEPGCLHEKENQGSWKLLN